MDLVKSKDFFENNNNFELIKDIKSNCLYGDESILNNVDLTICIPTYKRDKTLKDAIDSALNQKESNLKYCIIIVDNDDNIQNDSTRKLVESYNNSKLLYYKNEKNIGMFNNWNRCFEIAKSKWIALLHDDDFLKEDYVSYLEQLLPLINKKKVSCLCFAFDRLYADGRKQETVVAKANGIKKFYHIITRCFQNRKISRMDTYLAYLFGGNPFAIPSCGILFDREKVITTGGFDEKMYPTADSSYVLYLMHMKSVYFCHHAVGIYRWEYNESLKPEIYIKSVEHQRYETLFLGKKHKILNLLFNKELMHEKDLLLEHKAFKPSKLLILLRRIFMDTKLYSDSVNIYK